MRKLKNKTNALILILFILSACKRSENQKEIITQYDTLRRFYESGNIRYQLPTKNGKLNGNCKEFYPNGNLMSEKNYQDGELMGQTKLYYKNGLLKELIYFVGDNPFGHAYFYSENGNLETYNNFDFVGNPRYVRKYNDQGRIIKDEGSALGQLFIEESDSLILLFSFAKPPSTENNIKAFIYENNKYRLVNPLINENMGELIFEDKNDKIILIVGELIDSVSNEIIVRDSLFYPTKSSFIDNN